MYERDCVYGSCDWLISMSVTELYLIWKWTPHTLIYISLSESHVLLICDWDFPIQVTHITVIG